MAGERPDPSQVYFCGILSPLPKLELLREIEAEVRPSARSPGAWRRQAQMAPSASRARIAAVDCFRAIGSLRRSGTATYSTRSGLYKFTGEHPRKCRIFWPPTRISLNRERGVEMAIRGGGRKALFVGVWLGVLAACTRGLADPRDGNAGNLSASNR